MNYKERINAALDTEILLTAYQASVCAIIAGPLQNQNICFIKRSKWEGDPWSQHIALPGGKNEKGETPVQAVVREVQEEVGISITNWKNLIPLPQLQIVLGEKKDLLVLNPFIYIIEENIPALHGNEEVESAFWVPVTALWDVHSLDYLKLDDKGTTLVYPALKLQQGTVFGITLRVLMLLADKIGFPIPHLEEIPLLRRKQHAGHA